MSSEDDQFDDIQPDDDTDAETAASNTVKKRAQRVERDRELSTDARIRELIPKIEKALTGSLSSEKSRVQDPRSEDDIAWGDADPNALLIELGELLESHDEMPRALLVDVDKSVAVRYKSFREHRHRGLQPSDLVQEHSVYSAVAKDIGVLGAYTNRTQYAPVRVEALDRDGQESDVEPGEQTPIGRLRVAAADGVELEDRVVTIPTKKARHTGIVAKPRMGKDSTNVSICGNLMTEHGYKWVSLFDSGRMENAMMELPVEDPDVRRSVESFNQEPRGYPTTVYIPAVELPDRVPSNFEPFSISVDSLTTRIMFRVAGMHPSGSVEGRVDKALEEVQNGSGEALDLIEKLREYAEETTQVVTVRMEDDGDGDGDDDVAMRKEFEIGEDKVLLDIAEQLTEAAASGLIRDRGASTNLDMMSVLREQERVAALNATHLDEGKIRLVTLIWMELLWEARTENKDLPRVALEVREVKDLVPSKNSDQGYGEINKGLRQSFYDYGTKGSGAGIQMFTSMQKWKDTYKSVRTNLDVKILLGLDAEVMNEFGSGFSRKERESLLGFKAGMGMLIGDASPGPDKAYPIEWRGAKCGIHDLDKNWRDRYGKASGWRVADGTENFTDDTEYFNGEGDRVRHENEELRKGDWWLLPRDIRPHESIHEALQRRSKPGMPEVLYLEDPSEGIEEIEMEMMSTEAAQARSASEARDALPAALQPWLDRDDGLIERWVAALKTIDEESVGSYKDLAGLVGVGKGTISNWMKDDFSNAVEKTNGEYVLSPMGERAVEHEETLTRA